MNRLRFRIICVPPALDHVFHTLTPHLHWHHLTYFLLLAVVIAFAWSQCHVASLCRYLETPQHRTRFINFFFVARWDPAVALRLKARELLVVLHPRKGDTLYLVIDDSKKATRGVHMHAVAKMQDPMRAGYVRGHQYVCAILRFRDQVMPDGLRLYVKPEHCSASDLPFHQPTECVAPLMRACEAPAGVTVVVLVDPDELCGEVVQACRE